jgi:hypothetical protein
MNFRQDTRDADCCKRFLLDPRSLAEWEIVDLADTLHNRHIQSVVIQLISTELGWSPNLAVVPFLSIEDTKTGEPITKEMQRAGIPLKNCAHRLQASFPRYVQYISDTIGYLAECRHSRISSVNDSASVWWIAKIWDDRGRPSVEPEVWKEAEDVAVEKAVGSILVE